MEGFEQFHRIIYKTLNGLILVREKKKEFRISYPA